VFGPPLSPGNLGIAVSRNAIRERTDRRRPCGSTTSSLNGSNQKPVRECHPVMGPSWKWGRKSIGGTWRVA